MTTERRVVALNLRLPVDLHAALAARAEAHERSLQGEIIAVLRTAGASKAPPPPLPEESTLRHRIQIRDEQKPAIQAAAAATGQGFDLRSASQIVGKAIAGLPQHVQADLANINKPGFAEAFSTAWDAVEERQRTEEATPRFGFGDVLPQPATTEEVAALRQDIAEVRKELAALRRRVEGAEATSETTPGPPAEGE